MRSLVWGGLGVLVGAVVGVALLLTFHVPVLIAVMLGLAAVAATYFSWWADLTLKKRTRPEKRV